MATTSARLASIDVKGGLWGADLLAALADDRTALPDGTVTAQAYGLPARASTEQAARAAWTVLTAAWEEFTEHHQHRIATFDTPTYGADSFTWDKWTRHLLDQLGYDPQPTPAGGLTVDNPDPDDPVDTFPIPYTHHDQTPIHAVPAGAPLDTRSPGVKGAARQSPHSMVQHYLNRTSRHLWGLVTNGLTLRLLRDNAALSRQAYIEFDLAAVFDESAYADFALLWHAAHATRFTHDPDQPPTSCIAETWQDHATKTGVAALEDLRDGVEAAIAEIGQGLIEHPDNRALRNALADPTNPFDGNAFYRQLLYIAYRHVFWFALDDRDLLHPPDADRTRAATYRDHYASTVLRTKARAHRGARHPDGWQHFQTVATWFAHPDGRPELAVPGLLGRLWDDQATSHINGTTLTNRRYYEALRRLGYVQRDGVLQRINYDAMGSEELGAVYESLLEIRPVADPTTRTFTPDRTHGSDRKKTGSYYTPTSLIKVLLDEALDPVLDDRTKQAIHDLPPETTPDEQRAAQEAAILGTTVCDPAMGSAHFLVAAGMRIAKRLATARTDEVEPAPEAVQQAFRDVASRCLYGVDVNPMAVELAKLAIWLECHVPGQPLTFLDHHLKHGNALLGVGFDTDLIAWDRDAAKAADQGGVPDAAFKALAGDDKTHAGTLRDRNKKRRSRGSNLRFHSAGAHHDDLTRLAGTARQLTELADDTPAALAAKQQAWDAYEHDPELERQRLRADAWTASWTIAKTPDVTDPLITDDPLADDDLPWDVYYDTFFDNQIDPDRLGVRTVRDETKRHGPLHWYIEFPHIAHAGGFALTIGNPPWEQVELKPSEWFAAEGEFDIADADGSDQHLLIERLEWGDEHERRLHGRWATALTEHAHIRNFLSSSARYSDSIAGRLNTFVLFLDGAVSGSSSDWVAMLVPTSVATDKTYAAFFSQELLATGRLKHFFDFENRRGIFPDVHKSFRFASLVAGPAGSFPTAKFAFQLHSPEDRDDAERAYELAPADVELCSPQTGTVPVFSTSRVAELVLKSYRACTPLGVSEYAVRTFLMFNGTKGNPLYRSMNDGMVPVIDQNHFHILTFQSKDLQTAKYFAPRSAVRDKYQEQGWDEPFVLVWRKNTRATDSRTTIAALVPAFGLWASAYGLVAASARDALLLAAYLSTFVTDFVARSKFAGANFVQSVMEQLPVPSSTQLDRLPIPRPREWLSERAAAMSARDGGVARAIGFEGTVDVAASRSEVWQAELDAALFHAHGYSRSDVSDALDTFPIIAKRDRHAEGLDADSPDWRTKRSILAKYDDFGRCAEEGAVYESPYPPPPLPTGIGLSTGSGRG